MKIAVVHNRYAVSGRGSGEEIMIEKISTILRDKGHTLIPFIRSSFEIERQLLGKTRAFFSGIYNINVEKKLFGFLKREKPDLVFVQNVYPLFSPSALVASKKAGLPVVMRCPNYRLICPNGLLANRKNPVCEKCVTGSEIHCVLNNCESNLFKSIGYALRNYTARRFSFFKNYVDVFLVLTEFARNKLLENGFPPEKIQVLSGLAKNINMQPSLQSKMNGTYVGFAGRVSPEKGIKIFIEAASAMPGLPFKIAGDYKSHQSLVRDVPQNVELMGNLDETSLNKFYSNARIIVVPSVWNEGLPGVIIEAMQHGKPVICSNIGGLPEVVENDSTGLLFYPGNSKDLVQKIQLLWDNTQMCIEMGKAGKNKALNEYSVDAFYKRLLSAFETAIIHNSSR